MVGAYELQIRLSPKRSKQYKLGKKLFGLEVKKKMLESIVQEKQKISKGCVIPRILLKEYFILFTF